MISGHTPSIVPRSFFGAYLLMKAFPSGEKITSPSDIHTDARMITQIPTGSFVHSVLQSAAARTMDPVQRPRMIIPIAVFVNIPQSPCGRCLILAQIPAKIGQRMIQRSPFIESNHAVGISKEPMFQLAHPRSCFWDTGPNS